MTYIDKSLAPGEQILARGKWPTIFWVGAWAALLVLGIIIVGVFIFLRAAIIMNTTRFAVTDRRVILKRGWLNIQTQELSVETVEGVQLVQTLWGRLFGYGRVMCTGTGDAVIVFPPMANPVEFRRAIETARGTAKEVHIAEEDHQRLEAETAPVEEVVADDEDHPRRRTRPRRFLGALG